MGRRAHLALEQRQRQLLDQVALLGQQRDGALVRGRHERAHLLVDELPRLVAIGLVELPLLCRKADQPDLVIHAVHRDLRVRHLGDALQVVLRACAHTRRVSGFRV